MAQPLPLLPTMEPHHHPWQFQPGMHAWLVCVNNLAHLGKPPGLSRQFEVGLFSSLSSPHPCKHCQQASMQAGWPPASQQLAAF